jgi:hypothetical protein
MKMADWVEKLDGCIKNAMIQRKEMDNSDWAMHPVSLSCEFRIPSIEPSAPHPTLNNKC